jgi:hypothetical protein
LSLSAAGTGGADSSIDVAGLSEEEAALAVEVAATSEVGARFLEHATVYETMAEWVSKLDVLSAFASFATTSGDSPKHLRFIVWANRDAHTLCILLALLPWNYGHKHHPSIGLRFWNNTWLCILAELQ